MTLFVKKYLAIFSLATMFVGTLMFGGTKAYAANGDTIVYITKTGECYHADGCSSLKKSKIETTLKKAIDRGYRACSKCNPPVLDANNAAAPAASVVNTAAAATNKAVPNEVTYIGNANSKKFHKTSCYSASQISPENYVELTGSRDDAINQGYIPCKKCNP